MNKNDKPITSFDEIKKISFSTFNKKYNFTKLCTLIPDKENERLIIKDLGEDKRGLVYAMVCNDILLKVGSTITSMEDRIKSYNCGRKKFRENGTCSTTNYYVLQSLLNLGMDIEVYVFYPEEIKVNVFGEEVHTSVPPKLYEKSILRSLKEEGIMPTFCTQV